MLYEVITASSWEQRTRPDRSSRRVPVSRPVVPTGAPRDGLAPEAGAAPGVALAAVGVAGGRGGAVLAEDVITSYSIHYTKLYDCTNSTTNNSLFI